MEPTKTALPLATAHPLFRRVRVFGALAGLLAIANVFVFLNTFDRSVVPILRVAFAQGVCGLVATACATRVWSKAKVGYGGRYRVDVA